MINVTCCWDSGFEWLSCLSIPWPCLWDLCQTPGGNACASLGLKVLRKTGVAHPSRPTSTDETSDTQKKGHSWGGALPGPNYSFQVDDWNILKSVPQAFCSLRSCFPEYQLRLPQRGIYAARRTSRNLFVKFRQLRLPPWHALVRAPGFVEGSAVHPGGRIILQICWSLCLLSTYQPLGERMLDPHGSCEAVVFWLMTNWLPGIVTQLRAHQSGALQNLQSWHAACLLIVKSGNRTSTVSV